MPRPVTTPEQDALAYHWRVDDRLTMAEIGARLGFGHLPGPTQRSYAHRAVSRHAARIGAPDPANRIHEHTARRYARRARIPFDAEAFRREAGLAQAEQIGGALLTGRTFGIEIEFRRRDYTLTPERIADALNAAGVLTVVESYNHSTRAHWKLIHDASSDRELVSPVLHGREGLRQVRTAMRVLRDLNCYVSRSEGMHVHVYAGDLTYNDTAAVFRFYANRQRAFSMLVARGRRGSQTYTSEVTPRDAERVEAYARQGQIVGPRGTRYLSVNLDSYRRYQTIEFRQHQGSLNGRKACDWIELLLSIYAAVEAGNAADAPTDLWGMLDWLVEHRHLKRATADRLERKAAGYGFRRALAA